MNNSFLHAILIFIDISKSFNSLHINCNESCIFNTVTSNLITNPYHAHSTLINNHTHKKIITRIARKLLLFIITLRHFVLKKVMILLYLLDINFFRFANQENTVVPTIWVASFSVLAYYFEYG